MLGDRAAVKGKGDRRADLTTRDTILCFKSLIPAASLSSPSLQVG